MVLDTTSIVLSIFGLLIGVIAFFLQSVYADFKENKKDSELHKQKMIEDLGKLKGQLELAQQEQRLRHQQIEEKTQLELQNLASNVNKLASTVEKFINYSREEK